MAHWYATEKWVRLRRNQNRLNGNNATERNYGEIFSQNIKLPLLFRVIPYQMVTNLIIGLENNILRIKITLDCSSKQYKFKPNLT